MSPLVVCLFCQDGFPSRDRAATQPLQLTSLGVAEVSKSLRQNFGRQWWTVAQIQPSFSRPRCQSGEDKIRPFPEIAPSDWLVPCEPWINQRPRWRQQREDVSRIVDVHTLLSKILQQSKDLILGISYALSQVHNWMKDFIVYVLVDCLFSRSTRWLETHAETTLVCYLETAR